MSASITREAALRVALATKELNGLSAVELVSILVGRLDLPLTETKLAAVTVADLTAMFQGEDRFGREAMKQAVRWLWGEGVPSDLPSASAYAEGEMPGSIRVACASNSGEVLDGHFGSCERFLIYQVSPTECRLIDLRPTLEADQAEDRNVARAALIADCQVVYVQSIGGPATAKVVRAGVHPVKVGGGAVTETLARLQQALTSPPPWLARIMGVTAASLEKFAPALEDEAS